MTTRACSSAVERPADEQPAGQGSSPCVRATHTLGEFFALFDAWQQGRMRGEQLRLPLELGAHA